MNEGRVALPDDDAVDDHFHPDEVRGAGLQGPEGTFGNGARGNSPYRMPGPTSWLSEENDQNT